MRERGTMKEDRLIDYLRELDDEQESSDPRWMALAHGSLSEADAEALRREAPEEYEIFRPFDPARREAIIDRVLRGDRGAPEPPMFERIRARIAGARVFVTGLAASAAVAVAILFGGGKVPAVGEWSGSYKGGQLATLGAPSAGEKSEYEVVLGEGRLILLLRPAENVEYEPNYRCELEPVSEASKTAAVGGGPQVNFNPAIAAKKHAHGTVSIAGTRAELFPGLPEGTWKFICAVGPGELPKERLSTLPRRPEDQSYEIFIFDKLLHLKPRAGER